MAAAAFGGPSSNWFLFPPYMLETCAFFFFQNDSCLVVALCSWTRPVLRHILASYTHNSYHRPCMSHILVSLSLVNNYMKPFMHVPIIGALSVLLQLQRLHTANDKRKEAGTSNLFGAWLIRSGTMYECIMVILNLRHTIPHKSTKASENGTYRCRESRQDMLLHVTSITCLATP